VVLLFKDSLQEPVTESYEAARVGDYGRQLQPVDMIAFLGDRSRKVDTGRWTGRAGSPSRPFGRAAQRATPTMATHRADLFQVNCISNLSAGTCKLWSANTAEATLCSKARKRPSSVPARQAHFNMVVQRCIFRVGDLEAEVWIPLQKG